MYSDVDIRKDLGKHIGIFPLKEENIQGSCMLLTASGLAWSVNNKRSCVQNGKIHIAAHDTVIVLTNEVVYLDKRFAGYCMTRVSMLPMGIASICTPVKPGWIGHLFITLHNVSNRDYDLKETDGIVIMTIHKLRNTCKRGDPRTNSRIELLNNMGIQTNNEEINFINKQWANDSKILFDKMKEDADYKTIKRRLWRMPKLGLKIAGILCCLVAAGSLIWKYPGENMAGVLAGSLLAVSGGILGSLFKE